MTNTQSDRKIWLDLSSQISFWILILILVAKMSYSLTTVDPCSNDGKFTIGVNCAGVGAEKIRIGLAVVLFLIFSTFQKQLPRTVIMLPLVWIILEYILWLIGTYTLFKGAENTSSIRTLFFLYNANWLDIWVLVFVLVSFVCLLIKEITSQSMK